MGRHEHWNECCLKTITKNNKIINNRFKSYCKEENYDTKSIILINMNLITLCVQNNDEQDGKITINNWIQTGHGWSLIALILLSSVATAFLLLLCRTRPVFKSKKKIFALVILQKINLNKWNEEMVHIVGKVTFL